MLALTACEKEQWSGCYKCVTRTKYTYEDDALQNIIVWGVFEYCEPSFDPDVWVESQIWNDETISQTAWCEKIYCKNGEGR